MSDKIPNKLNVLNTINDILAGRIVGARSGGVRIDLVCDGYLMLNPAAAKELIEQSKGNKKMMADATPDTSEYFTNEREQELIKLADQGYCASAIRLAICETAQAIESGRPAEPAIPNERVVK